MKQDIDETLVIIMVILAAILGVLTSIGWNVINIAKHFH